MTEKKSLKRRVRNRMAKTGERYTAARRQVLAKSSGAETTAKDTDAQPANTGAETATRERLGASEAAVLARTGRPWSEWFELLQAWDAAARPHRDIARWLSSEHGVDGWWAQELTVRFEKAIGRRRLGQRGDTFAASASRTIDVPVERLFEAFVSESGRSRWLPGESLRVRTATPHRSARFDWSDGTSRLIVSFAVKGEAKSTVSVEHERLPDAQAATRMRAFWRERLGALKGILEEQS